MENRFLVLLCVLAISGCENNPSDINPASEKREVIWIEAETENPEEKWQKMLKDLEKCKKTYEGEHSFCP